MLVNTGAFLRSELKPLQASPVAYNTAGIAAGAAGGSLLFGLATTGNVARNVAGR